MKKFYIETFGCQMNVHDSEKVIGTLVTDGYTQVENFEEADLVLYNTCSIRDKAEQKVFNRLQNFRKAGKGKTFAVIGCVAQQEGEKIFEKAPHVSLVAGSASYGKLSQLLVQIEKGDKRVTGLSFDASEAFETPMTRRDNPHRAYITIIEGCDKNCAYCVVPFTRGPERSRTSESIVREAHEIVAMGYSEVQLLGQNVNSYRDPSPAGFNFAKILRAVAEVPGMRRVRFTTSHPRDFGKDIVDVIADHPAICNHVHLPVQSGSSKVLEGMLRSYTRDEYMRRIDWMKNCGQDIALTTDIIVGFPGETETDFEQTLSLLDEVEYDSVFSFKYSKRPNTPALSLDDHMDEDEKSRRLSILQERQRQIQIRRNAAYVGRVEEVLVEGFNKATGQWIGRTGQNKTLNFLHHSGDENLTGTYLHARVTRSGPNSLAGESVVQ